MLRIHRHGEICDDKPDYYDWVSSITTVGKFDIVSFCRFTKLKKWQFRLIYASVVFLCGSALFGHAFEEGNEVHEPRAPEDLTPDEISEIQSRSQAILAALSEAIQRGETENIPISNRTYPFDRPIAIGDFIPLKFKPIQTLPKVLLQHATGEGLRVDERRWPLWFMEKFNVHLLAEDDAIELPSSITMFYSVERHGVTVDRNVSMVLNRTENAYYFERPFELMESMLNAVEEVKNADPRNRNRPTLEIHELTGFQDVHKYAQDNYFPTGVPIVYSLRIGDLRLHTSHSWVGRANELTEVFNETLWLK